MPSPPNTNKYGKTNSAEWYVRSQGAGSSSRGLISSHSLVYQLRILSVLKRFLLDPPPPKTMILNNLPLTDCSESHNSWNN
jgi:hypothetical protein